MPNGLNYFKKYCEMFCLFWKQKFEIARARARARESNIVHVHVLVQVEVVGFEKFLGYVNDRVAYPYLFHYSKCVF